MQLKNIAVKNFRLLHDAGLILEKQTTVIVGRNNSGKTSLTEVMKRLLGDSNPYFRLEDFSFATHQSFWNAFVAAAKGADEPDVRKALKLPLFGGHPTLMGEGVRDAEDKSAVPGGIPPTDHRTCAGRSPSGRVVT
jgi:ABC-type cobalamin/Fe3+-siderophores transport system ATPase subunit